MKRTTGNKALAAALAAMLLAGACGSSGDDDASDTEATESTESRNESLGGAVDQDTTDDALDERVTADDGGDEEAAMAEDAPEEAEAMRDSDAEGDAAAAPATTTANQTGGLFNQQEDVEEPSTEDNFAKRQFRDFISTAEDPLSTFALDVDTGSYSIARRSLTEGRLPDPDSVRPEEYMNALRYDYPAPRDALGISIEGGPSPFDGDYELVRIGVSSEEIDERDRPQTSLTFVIDTSGSMNRPDRLDLVKESLELLAAQLDDEDTIAIVIYSDRGDVILDPTPVRNFREITQAIDGIQPGGSTNLESGLRVGYDLANEAFIEGGINRVVIASDGLANAGITGQDDLVDLIRRDADNGIELITLGYGMGGFNDELMEQLADNGEGFYAYIDSYDEAQKLFTDQLTASLVTIARDAKIQVEFNPDVVDNYRLIGFENRGVRDSDFRNDDVDAGEIGSGHQVTALYEVELVPGARGRDSVGVVNLRWENPTRSGEIVEISEEIGLQDIEAAWGDTSASFRLATTVATWAEILRENELALGSLTNPVVTLEQVADEAESLARELNDPTVDEFAELTARSVDTRR